MASVALHADLRTAKAVRLLMLVDGLEASILVIEEGGSAAGRDVAATEIAGLGRFEPSHGDLLDYNGAQRDVVGSVDGCGAPVVRIGAASAKDVLDPASRSVEKRYRYVGSGADREDWNDRSIRSDEVEAASGCARVDREWGSWEGRAR